VPPVKKFTRDEIVDIAAEIVKKDGFKGLNARKLASKLGSSVNPIFNNFASMEEVNAAVYEKIYGIYKVKMLEGSKSDLGYKGMGLAYIEFAREYPEYFKILFMQKTDIGAENFIMADAIGDEVIQKGQKMTGFSFEEQKKFHVKVWFLTHGMACLVATHTIDLSRVEVDKILEEAVREMVKGHIKG